MPSLSLRDVALATPDGHPLVPSFTFTFGPHRTGVIGRNGVGKTTLLRVISGATAPASGTVQRVGGVGVLNQVPEDSASTVAEALGVADALARLARLESGSPRADDLENAQWDLPARIASTLDEVGLPWLAPDRPIATLSGGQHTRLALAALLLARPDIIVLDEPTNNLDGEGRTVVGRLLAGWPGIAIVASHDRELLRHMDELVELTPLGLQSYGGNWDHYEARKAIALSAAEHDLDVARKELRDIDRRAQERRERKAKSDARGAHKASRGDMPRIIVGGLKRAAENTTGMQSRLAERRQEAAQRSLETAREKIEVLTPLSVSLESTRLPAGRVVLRMNDVSWHANGVPVLVDRSLLITGPERVALRGPNGSGKTTLLKLATGALTPSTGQVWITPRHALLDQHVTLLDPTRSVRDNFTWLNPHDDENACRAALARFKFRADAALQSVDTLSGGEKLRAGLAVTIGAAHAPELLILDEPTNHLDLDAIAALEAGLRAYDGALLVVSHDAAFLEAIGIDRTVDLASP